MAPLQTPAWHGQLRQQEPLARHTSWRVGGPADHFYEPDGLDDLCCFLASLPENEEITWLGLGSNILVRDAGLRGTVISVAGMLDKIGEIEDGVIRVEAGVACAKFARLSSRQGYTGAEFLAGIPGTIGGALAMNAGAFGGETWEIVTQVETVNQHGQRQIRSADQFEIGYRHVQGQPDEWFVAGWFALKPDAQQTGMQRIRELLAKRGATQPTGLPSCGSVFRNPQADHAARLIEACGLKGYRIGQAGVSEKHANFIINHGNARAADIEALIDHVAQTVEQQQGVRLIREVRILGEKTES